MHELIDDYSIHSCVKEELEKEKESVQESQVPIGRCSCWIGKDYRKTFSNKESETNWERPFDYYEGFDRSQLPRMPWHDVGCAFTLDAVLDAIKHALKPRFGFFLDSSASGSVDGLVSGTTPRSFHLGPHYSTERNLSSHYST